MTNYKVRVRGSKGWSRYKSSKLNVSVSQPYLNGAKLKSIVNWINQNFEHCIVSIGDTLNRHNLLADGHISEEKAYNVTKESGDAWIKRNTPILDGIQIQHKILQWDDTLTDTATQLIKEYHDLYKTDAGFKAAVDADVADYSKRKSIEARDYILEELGVDTDIARSYPNATLYPGKSLRSYDYIRENGKAISAPYGLQNEHHVYIDVRRIKRSNDNRKPRQEVHNAYTVQ